MAAPNPQPILPAEGLYTETERLFIAEEPPTTFPSNQHSNWGLLRAVLTDEVQDAVDDLNALFNEIFISTATAYLSDWETQMGLPISTSLPDSSRRTSLASRRTRAPFTRTRVKSVIERFINDTFGPPATFGAAGIPLTSAGIPLYATAGSVPTLYRVYEDIKGFAYTVRVVNTITPSAALPRELAWMTPAHIALTYDNSLANILSYPLEIRNSQPIIFMRMSSLVDASGYAVPTPTAQGGATVGTVAALLSNTGDNATSLDGVDDYISIPDFGSTWPFTSMSLTEKFSMEAWIKPTVLPASGNFRLALGKNAAYLGMVSNGVDPAGMFCFNAGGTYIASPSSFAVVNSIYHLVGTFDGTTARLYVNGVLVASGARTGGSLGGAFTIGGAAGTFLQGVIDEAALYDRALTPAEILLHYNTGMNIA